MKISKAKTHWKGRWSEAACPGWARTDPASLSLLADALPEGRPHPHRLPQGPQKANPSLGAFQRARGGLLSGPREKQASAPPGSCSACHTEGRQGQPASWLATLTPAGARLIFSPACRT